MSLSNTLFRRDAGAFAAYLVDAETGKLYEGGLSNGQRENDLEIARVNIAGELLDLEAGGRVADELDPVRISNGIVEAYRSLWTELTGSESFSSAERWRINERVNRLNDLGFDIEELAIRTDDTGTTVRIQPKVVDAGHHQRRLLRLTGLDAGENQARRLLNDLDSYRAAYGKDELDEEMVAHEWLMRVFEPVVRAIPLDLRGKLEPAEVFHQLLEHRWFMAQQAGHDIPLAEAVTLVRQHDPPAPPRRGDGDRPGDRCDHDRDRRRRPRDGRDRRRRPRRRERLAPQRLTRAAAGHAVASRRAASRSRRA